MSGDLDQNAHPDLVVATQGNNALVFLMESNGAYAQQTRMFTVPLGGLTLGDFDGDSNLDIVLVTPSVNTVHIYLGNGAGVFQDHFVGISSGASVALAVRPAGDQHLSLLLAYPDDRLVAFLAGDGAGGFSSVTSHQLPGRPVHFSTGKLQSGAAFTVGLEGSTGSVTALLPGTGATVHPVTLVNTGSQNTRVLLGDVDGNGVADLVLGSTSGPSVNVLLNEANGFFAGPPVVYPVGDALLDLALGDFNRDGREDVVVLTSTGLQLWTAEANGSLTPALTAVLGGTPVAMLVTDLDGDGNPDVAVTTDTSQLILLHGACN